jgi:hypothetical protein
MLERLTHSLHILLGERRIVLVRRKRWLKVGTQVLADVSLDPGQTGDASLLGLLDQMLADISPFGEPVYVALADGHMRTWRVHTPPGASTWSDCEAAIAMRFKRVFDEAPDAWLMSPVQSLDTPFMASGVRRRLVSELDVMLRRRRLSLASVKPEFALLWNHWYPALGAHTWFGICRRGSLSLGIVDGECLQALRSFELNGAEQEAAGWLAKVLALEADKMNLPQPKALAVCGERHPAWSDGAGPIVCRWLGPQASALALLGIPS